MITLIPSQPTFNTVQIICGIGKRTNKMVDYYHVIKSALSPQSPFLIISSCNLLTYITTASR